MSEMPFAAGPFMGLLAATPAAGFTLQNATPTVLSWTAPNDGAQHRVMLIAGMHVTSLQTGGAVTLNTNLPDGTAANPSVFGGGLAAGPQATTVTPRIVQPGATITLVQSSAQTAGAAVMWAELWGS